MERIADSTSGGREEALCQVCGASLSEGGEVVRCERCDTPHHAACWRFNEGCSTYGCKSVRSVSIAPSAEVAGGSLGGAEASTPSEGADDAPVLVIDDAGPTEARWLVVERGSPYELSHTAGVVQASGVLGSFIALCGLLGGDNLRSWLVILGLSLLAWLVPWWLQRAGASGGARCFWSRWRFDLAGRLAVFERASTWGWRRAFALPLSEVSSVDLVRAKIMPGSRQTSVEWWLEARTPRGSFRVGDPELYGREEPPDGLLGVLAQLRSAGVEVDAGLRRHRLTAEGTRRESRRSRRRRAHRRR